MSDAKLMLKLTAEQQKQVFEATGKTYTELTFDTQSVKLPESALRAVVGGTTADKQMGQDLEEGSSVNKLL